MDPFLDILEDMAQATFPIIPDDVQEYTILQWQALFGYSFSEASLRIKEHRDNPPEIPISDDHWCMVRDQMMAKGFDREAYEHSCNTGLYKTTQKQETTQRQKRKLQATAFLVKLNGPLNSVKAVVEAAGLPSSSGEVVTATDSSGQVSSFYEINGVDKIAIEEFLKASQTYSTFTPTFVQCTQARKCLSPYTLYPTLGIDSTLPQHRFQDLKRSPRPAQNDFPVWYFFYGTLTEPSVITRLLSIEPSYRNAQIRGGVLQARGQYKALVNDQGGLNVLHGKAFLVGNVEQEIILRIYETKAYEVVRCCIEMEEGEVINGLTFRLIEETID
ncbi:hypothetical protein NW762_009267 [Fusarium torreyae]|uniref:Putative gamma-glutamylcyclotransferase n=1 Tax=Fusarium torreyae TaxID=1237075 RepID=A0A9W8VEW3_9HYPO|nr:hypothetical protein NW762_009267 [Fusarium torreyae]